MFTGLVETMGVIAWARSCGGGVELCVKPDIADFAVKIGGSVAVDGVCLTLEKREAERMFFTSVAETLGRTTLGTAAAGRRVNLERAMRADARLDGHIVLGHADAVGRIVSDKRAGASTVRTVEVPPKLAPFMAEKGSVAIDGISLTIANVNDCLVSVSLIQATMERTTMSIKKAGDSVNIECDVLVRYMHRMMTAGVLSDSDGEKNPDGNESLVDKMKRLGF